MNGLLAVPPLQEKSDLAQYTHAKSKSESEILQEGPDLKVLKDQISAI